MFLITLFLGWVKSISSLKKLSEIDSLRGIVVYLFDLGEIAPFLGVELATDYWNSADYLIAKGIIASYKSSTCYSDYSIL